MPGAAACVFAAAVAYLFYLCPLSGAPRSFMVIRGSGLGTVAADLEREGFIRSAPAFKFLGVATGHAGDIQPGYYTLDPAAGAVPIFESLLSGPPAVRVTIPEGSSLWDVDEILSAAGVTERGQVAAYAASHDREGYLFPDTYHLYKHMPVADALAVMTDNFAARAAPVLAQDAVHARENLIVASLLEREVTDDADRRIVAGILKKRLAKGMPLQVDATICYIKRMREFSSGNPFSCYPLTSIDFKADSRYNTYLYSDLPPGPVGSPGVSALEAALRPEPTPYWYYLTDPATKKTVFAMTNGEQEANRAKYLHD